MAPAVRKEKRHPAQGPETAIRSGPNRSNPCRAPSKRTARRAAPRGNRALCERSCFDLCRPASWVDVKGQARRHLTVDQQEGLPAPGHQRRLDHRSTDGKREFEALLLENRSREDSGAGFVRRAAWSDELNRRQIVRFCSSYRKLHRDKAKFGEVNVPRWLVGEPRPDRQRRGCRGIGGL